MREPTQIYTPKDTYPQISWICGAQAVLDPNNDYDREMLTNIASYVDKRRVQPLQIIHFFILQMKSVGR